MKKITIFILVILLLVYPLAGCASDSTSSSSSTAQSESSQVNESDPVQVDLTSYTGFVAPEIDLTDIVYEYKDSDTTSDYNANSTTINLDDMSVSGSGAETSESTVTITREGSYIVSGTQSDGQIIVEVDSEDKVQLVLDGANITNSTGPAIYVSQAEKVIITLAEGSTNTVSDSANYADTADGTPDAAIYAGDDLTINGTGSLTVIGNYLHGIKSVDDLVIMSGTIDITAAEEGLKGKDSVIIAGGNIDITAGGDGIKTDNDETKGYIIIDGGTIKIESKLNGIESQQATVINGGIFKIIAGGDGIHSNGNIQINGGDFIINVADDGAHADNILEVNGGNITIESSYEGLEGAYYTGTGGTVIITASDDGINAAGGSDGDAAATDRFQQEAIGDYLISISGGYTYVNAGGDGLDSNGNIIIGGGTLVIDGAVTDMGDPAIDAHSAENFLYVGGTLASVGCDSLFIAPTTDEQPAIVVMLGDLKSADQFVTITDSDGNSIVSFKPQKDFETITISSPELQLGETYSIITGGSYGGETIDGTYYTGGQLEGGDEMFSFTFTDTTMVLDASGNATDTSNYGTNPGGGTSPGTMPGNMPGQRQ